MSLENASISSVASDLILIPQEMARWDIFSFFINLLYAYINEIFKLAFIHQIAGQMAAIRSQGITATSANTNGGDGEDDDDSEEAEEAEEEENGDEPDDQEPMKFIWFNDLYVFDAGLSPFRA